MRTRNFKVFFVLCILLCCLVPQCHLFGLRLIGNGIGNVLAISHAIGVAMRHSLFHSFLTTVAHGFTMFHTMTLALFSGFIMGNIALVAFMTFLMAIVPAEEVRSLGGSSIFAKPALPFYSSSSRHKRSAIVNTSIPEVHVQVDGNGDIALPKIARKVDQRARFPRFLTRIVQRDPLNCLPLVMCGLSAAQKPNGRTDIVNDYAYLMKEFISANTDDKSDEDSRETGFPGGFGKLRDQLEGQVSRRRRKPASTKFGNSKREKDVDDIIDDIQRDEDDNIEDLVLTEMANDPNDLPFALEDMKVRGVQKTMSKLPHKSKHEYLEKLLGESAEEGEEYGEDLPPPMELRGHYPRHEYPDSSSPEDDRFMYSKEFLRGEFPPPPPVPPTPMFDDNELYKRNLKLLDENLAKIDSYQSSSRGKRELRAAENGIWRRKRREASEADDIFAKTRVAAEAGALARNSRQCRTLFRECPVSAIGKATPENGDTPFLQRAVNNIRKVLIGPQPQSTKQKRIKEIKEVIEQLHPPVQQAGSEVKVVLNIGPTPPPLQLHRAGEQSSPPTVAQPVPYEDSSTTMESLATSPTPPSSSTNKIYEYNVPSSSATILVGTQPPSEVPSTTVSLDLDSLEQMLKIPPGPSDSEEDLANDDFLTGAEKPPNLYAGVDHYLPTKQPMTREEYAQSLRETLGMFDRFKNAHKNPKTSPKPKAPKPSKMPKPVSTTQASKQPPKDSKVPKKPVSAKGQDVPQADIQSEKGPGDNLQTEIESSIKGVFNYLVNFATKRKKNKDHHDDGSSEEGGSGEDGSSGPDGGPPSKHKRPTHPPLVAVPWPHLRNQIMWRSGSTLLKDGFYSLLFKGKEIRPLTPHHAGEAPHHEPHNRHPPPRHHHKHKHHHKGHHHKGHHHKGHHHKGHHHKGHHHKGHHHKGHHHKGHHHHKHKGKFRSESTEENDADEPSSAESTDVDHLPPPPPPPPVLLPVPSRMEVDIPPDRYDSQENSDSSDEMYPVRPTEPQLVFSPFAIMSGNRKNMSKPKKKPKKSKKSSPAPATQKNKVSKTANGMTTTTAKPKRRRLKYKNG